MTVRIAAPSIEHHRSRPRHRRARAATVVESPERPSGGGRPPTSRDRPRRTAQRPSPSRVRDQVLVAWPDAPLRRGTRRVRVPVAGADGAWSELEPPRPSRPACSSRPTGSRDPWAPPGTRTPTRTTGAPRSSARDFEVGEGLCSRAPVRDRARPVRGGVNGTRVGDDVLSPGWTVYGAAPALLHLRRDRPAAARPKRHRRLARRRLVPRAARLARRLPQPVRRRPVVPRPARAHLRRRPPRDGRDRRRVEGRALPHPAHRHLRRRGLRRPRGAGRAGPAPASTTTRGKRVAGAPPRPATLVAPHRPARALHRGSPPGRGAHRARAARASSTSARTSSAGCASA